MRMWYTVHAEARLASRPVVGRRESVGLVHRPAVAMEGEHQLQVFVQFYVIGPHTLSKGNERVHTHTVCTIHTIDKRHSFWLRDRLCCTWRVASKSLLSAYSRVQRCSSPHRLVHPPSLPPSFHLPVSHVAAHVTCRVTRWMSTGHTASLPDTVSCTSACLQTSQKPLALYPNTGGADRIKRETGNMAKKAWTLTTYPCATSWNVFWRFFSFLRCFVCYWFFFFLVHEGRPRQKEKSEKIVCGMCL